MKILLFGKDGQIGWELQRSLAMLGKLWAVHVHSTDHCGDFNDLDGITQTIRTIAPDLIVNAAAYTAVDRAESEPYLCRSINALAPERIAEETKRLNAWLVHYSTDYVFDGSGNKPWLETDQPGPLNTYGVSKLEAESAILASGCQHLIFRTSWVYASRGANFAKTILRLAKSKDSLNVINDQLGAPTGADLLADITAHAVIMVRKMPQLSGIYHAAAGGETSWYEYASFVIDLARQRGVNIQVKPDLICAVASSAFATAAQRPHNSRLNTDKLKNTFGFNLPHWQTGVTRMLTEILEEKT